MRESPLFNFKILFSIVYGSLLYLLLLALIGESVFFFFVHVCPVNELDDKNGDVCSSALITVV